MVLSGRTNTPISSALCAGSNSNQQSAKRVAQGVQHASEFLHFALCPLRRLAHVSCVAEGVAARLRPDRKAVGLTFHRNAFDVTRLSVNGVDDVVIAA
jgi:hypothetical protein